MDAILAASHRNHARDGLTGVLVPHGKCYIQIAEGPGQALEGFLRRLDHDVRNRDLASSTAAWPALAVRE